jgi:hypothetical protein
MSRTWQCWWSGGRLYSAEIATDGEGCRYGHGESGRRYRAGARAARPARRSIPGGFRRIFEGRHPASASSTGGWAGHADARQRHAGHLGGPRRRGDHGALQPGPRRP